MGAQGIAPAAIHETVQYAYSAVNQLDDHRMREPELGLVNDAEYVAVAKAFREEQARDPAGVAAALRDLNDPDAIVFTSAGGPNSGQQVVDLVNAVARGDDFGTFNRRHQSGMTEPGPVGVRVGGRPRG